MTQRLKQQVIGDRVRALRDGAGLSLRKLAASTGFSASFISQLENGQVSPSISSMEKIAESLGVTLGQFFTSAAGEEGAAGTVVRARNRPTLSSGWSHADIASLGPVQGPHSLETTLVSLQPGGRSGKHPYPHPREEFAYVLQGAVFLRLGLDEHRLGRGDSVTMLAGETRLWENRSEKVAQILLVSARAKD